MTDQQIKDTIRGFLQSSKAGDVKSALSFFTEDALWTSPHGTFKGTAQIEKFLTWMSTTNKERDVTEIGIGIITQGDIGVIEHKLSGIYFGGKWESPTVCIYDFKNGKIANVRAFYDVLSEAQQASKGMFAKWIVNMVVNASRKGLK